ncbi:hypothetical protein AQUCO_01500178v1 [Aquilegia coerulea]|uniref:Uncharacterized protein n=1 Tax=Aquilegia coerulea TaxID=218851 RepID=A0A2G5DSF2_AQUCA|nr:hypothetical protein AQUCO_01500178v1 [Aquilegia coerulea]
MTSCISLLMLELGNHWGEKEVIALAKTMEGKPSEGLPIVRSCNDSYMVRAIGPICIASYTHRVISLSPDYALLATR